MPETQYLTKEEQNHNSSTRKLMQK